MPCAPPKLLSPAPALSLALLQFSNKKELAPLTIFDRTSAFIRGCLALESYTLYHTGIRSYYRIKPRHRQSPPSSSKALSLRSSMTTAAAAVVNGILALTSLVPALPQSITNGASVLGTLSAPSLSLTGVGGVISWGSDTVSNTNPYTAGPVSGKVALRFRCAANH